MQTAGLGHRPGRQSGRLRAVGTASVPSFAWHDDRLLAERFEDQGAREYIYSPGTFKPLALVDTDGRLYYYPNDQFQETILAANAVPFTLIKTFGDS